MSDETYELDVRCGNCGHEGRVELPRGTPFKGAGLGFSSSKECRRCGCRELVRHDKPTLGAKR
jgi:hypothetical protein